MDTPGVWKLILVGLTVGTCGWEAFRLSRSSRAQSDSLARERHSVATTVACFAALIFLANALPAVGRVWIEWFEQMQYAGASVRTLVLRQVGLLLVFHTLLMNVWEIAGEFARSDSREHSDPLVPAWILRSARGAVIILSQIFLLSAGHSVTLLWLLGALFAGAALLAFRRTATALLPRPA